MLGRLRDVLIVNLAIVNAHHLLVLAARYIQARQAVNARSSPTAPS